MTFTHHHTLPRRLSTKKSHWASAAGLATALACLGNAVSARADAAPNGSRQSYVIAAGSLAGALNRLAETGGVQLIYDSGLTQGLKTKGISGSYRPQEALRRLLEGSGLRARASGPGAYTIEQATGAAPTSRLGDPHTLGKVTVTGKAGYDTDDPYNPDYNRPNASTATKTDTPIFETPVDIQVVPRAVMDDQKSTRLTDALQNVSGVRPLPTLGLGTGFIVRGFNSPNTYRNGLITNGANAGFPSEFDAATLQSVEVLKGPAAVLYGRIEPGGLINITTKKPLDIPYYSLEQQFGSFDFYRTQWDAAGPVTEDGSLLYRFAGAYQDNKSFRDLITNDRLVVSPTVRWKPTNATDITLNVEGLVQNFQADFGIPVIGKRPAPIPVRNSFSDPNDPIDNQSKVHLNTMINHRFNEDWAIHSNFLATYDHGNSTFMTPANSFGDALRADNRTLDRNVFFQENDAEIYTTNLNLTGKFKLWQSQHSTLVGMDYTRGFSTYHTQGDWEHPIPSLAINIYDPRSSYGIDPTLIRNALLIANPAGRNYSVFKDEWAGLYFQDHITLWDKLHVLGGGRYDWAETGRGRGSSFSAAGKDLSPNLKQDEGFSPRVGVLYQPWYWGALYGNWTTSFNANNGTSAVGSTFEPERGEQFEAGIKTQLFNDGLTGTLAYYHITKSNILTPDLSTPDPFDSKAIGKTRSQGIEMDVTGHISDTVSLIGSYAFTDARITHDNSGNQGHRMTNVPEHSGSLWLKYDMNGYASREGFSFGVGTFVTGQREGDFENTFQLPGYVRVDALAAYRTEVSKAKVTVQLNIRNLLNKHYYESTDPFFNVAPRLGVYPGAPLTAIGSIRVEY